MMSWCPQFCHSCNTSCSSYCPFPQWVHPLLCNCTHLCSAECENGPTLVIHSILLEPCGNQSCTPRTFSIRITGPSYPAGETFSLRAGSCTEVDEPLVITNLEPGQYEIEQLGDCDVYDTTFTGAICEGSVAITASCVPTVITIVNRKRLCRRRRCRHNGGCGHSCGGNGCGSWNGCWNGCGHHHGCGHRC